MYIKKYDSWNDSKKKVNETNSVHTKRKYRRGEIRWAALGVNIGSEIDGKGKEFLRPVLILEKASPDLYLIIPLSTKLKSTLGYTPLELKDKTVSACIHQVRVISHNRMYSRLEKVADTKLLTIKEQCKNYFHF